MHLTLPDFDTIRALIVGDALLDQYWSGNTGRISPEAPVPVVAVENEQYRIGGAGNVAVNIVALGAHAALLAPIGPDQSGRTLSKLLKSHKIENRMIVQKDMQTPRKLRVVSQQQQLIRLDFEEQAQFNQTVFEQTYRSALNHSNVVILSDYGKGALNDPQSLIKITKSRGVPVFVDPKREDWGAYAGATVITPNRRELEAITGPLSDLKEIAAQAQKLCKKHRIEAMLVTLGEQGMLLQQGRKTIHLGATARDVFDVTGAGDTVIATFAAAWTAGQSPEEALRLANLAAGEVVGKFGTAAVTPAELIHAGRRERALETGVVSPHSLRRLVHESREAGETLVFTNGCFDLLHAGHVSLLEEAATLGDRLIVAINNDASVRRNKGSNRPIQPLQYRQQVLAGLECVDWVVPFAQKTPRQLIDEIRPDVLVKGADYQPDEIVGADTVTADGGKVVVLPLLEGYSTSELVRRICESDD